MVTIELFKGMPFNNANRMSKFSDYASQKAYFDGYDSSKKTSFEDVKFSSLYNPVVLESTITGLFEYTYGRIIFSQSERIIYFSVNRFEIVTDSKSLLYYDIDYWETFRYPISNDGNGCELGKGTIYRFSLDKPYRKIRAYNPIYKSAVTFRPIVAPSKFSLVVCWHDNSSGWDMVSVVQSSDKFELISNSWAKYRNFDTSKVFSYWLSPFYINTDNYSPQWQDVGHDLKMFDFEKSTFARLDFSYKLMDLLPDWSEEYQIGLTDANRNLIWIEDDNLRCKNIIIHLGVSMSGCSWYGFAFDGENPDYHNPANQFTIPCEPLDIFSDAFISYYSQERPFLEESRRIQRDQAFINGMTNMGTSVVGGAIAGSMVAPGAGTVAGAIGGAISSVVGSTVGYETNKIFNKEIQRNEDRQAKMASDELRFNGTSISEIINLRTIASVVKIYPDSNTYQEYLNDVNTFGYFCDTEVDNVDNEIGDNVNVKITCNVNVENVPNIASVSIYNRLMNGVTFIRPSN